jgi:SPP1 family predicted phage head-tail adaptor
VRTGQLRQRVKLLRARVTRDARGQEATVFDQAAALWADLRPLAGREAVSAAALQTTAQATWRATIRWTPGLVVTTADRVGYAGRTFDILAVLDLNESHHAVQLDLKEHA